MGFLSRLFGRGEAEEPRTTEHAVIVQFRFHGIDLSLVHALEDELESAITRASVGEYDGNDIAVGGGDCFLYMYGPDADRLFEVVRPLLEASSLMDGAVVKKRYGPPEDGVPETSVRIGS